jgi:hypothetical protein
MKITSGTFFDGLRPFEEMLDLLRKGKLGQNSHTEVKFFYRTHDKALMYEIEADVDERKYFDLFVEDAKKEEAEKQE